MLLPLNRFYDLAKNKETIEQKQTAKSHPSSTMLKSPLEQSLSATDSPLSIPPPPELCRKRSSSLPANLDETESSGKPLFWFRPKISENLTHCIRQSIAKRQENNTIRDSVTAKNENNIFDLASSYSSCFSDDDSATNNCWDDRIDDQEAEDLRGLSLLR